MERAGSASALVDTPAEPETFEPTIPAGQLSPWTVGELPTPPKLQWGPRSLVGPGLMMAGAAIGGGEWLMGPAVTAKYGGAIMWLATVSIVAQVIYNTEVMRYALYCGEPIFVGFFRLLPGPKFWTIVYLSVDFFGLWPYLCANAAVPLAAAILGHLPAALPMDYLSQEQLVQTFGITATEAANLVQHPEMFGVGPEQTPLPAAITSHMDGEKRLINWLAYGIFVVSFIPLVFGGKIYDTLVRIMVTKIVFVLGYLLLLTYLLVSWATMEEILAGFLFLSKTSDGQWGFHLIPEKMSQGNIDWALLGAFAAVAGTGGLTNSQFSSYSRDRGWGMGAHVGAIPSFVGGRGITLAHTGVAFHPDAQSLPKWKGWLAVIRRDQWVIWLIGCILGMAIPSFISRELLPDQEVSGSSAAAATAQAIANQTGSTVFWFLTLFCGFIVLAPNQISTTDGLLRRWTDVLWAGNSKLKHLPGEKVRHVYFGLLAAYFVWGLLILVWIGDQPIVLLKASGVILNFILGFSALHTLAVNVILLPKPLRPGWFSRIGLVGCGLFFMTISVLGAHQALIDLKVLSAN